MSNVMPETERSISKNDQSPFGFGAHLPAEFFDRLFLHLRDPPRLEAVYDVQLYPLEKLEHFDLRDVCLRLRVNLSLPCKKFKNRCEYLGRQYSSVSRDVILYPKPTRCVGHGRGELSTY